MGSAMLAEHFKTFNILRGLFLKPEVIQFCLLRKGSMNLNIKIQDSRKLYKDSETHTF
jgi:hypothetical protein